MKPLPPGGTIGVAAPASPYDARSEVLRGVEWWQAQGYRVKLADGVFARDDYVAGDAEQRAADLNALFSDPEVDVVQALQGGYGSAQTIPYLDFDAIAGNPKPFVGFSDITALHVAIGLRTGMPTFYGNGLVGVGDPESTDFTRARLLQVLAGDATGEVPRNPDDPYVRAIRGGKVTAPLVGGCLWLLLQTMGTPWELELDGSILFFEDYKAPPYYVDGMLTQLRPRREARGRDRRRRRRDEGLRLGRPAPGLGLGAVALARGRAGGAPRAARRPVSSTGCRSATASTSQPFRSAFGIRSTPTRARSSSTARRSRTERKEGRMRKGLAAVATLLLAASVVAGCGGSKSSSSGTTGSVKEGGTLRLGTSSRIDSLNPYVAFNQDAYSTFMYIYPFLVQYDKDLNFTPEFATKWETSKDGLTWTFHTVPNAKWSDGKPLTAEDAAWTINTDVKYQGTGGANTAGLIAHIKSASAPDPNTLVVKYEKPVGNVLSQFQQLAILPKHIWAGYTGHKGADLKTFPNAAPIVSGGTFILTKFKKDEIALFERNPSFYGPKPHIKGFGLRMFSNDDALVSAMKSGEIDAIESVPPTAIDTLKKAGVIVSIVPGVTTNDFIFNANTEEDEPPRASQPEAAGGLRPRDRPRQDHQGRLARHGEAGDLVHPARDGRLAQPEPQARDI